MSYTFSSKYQVDHLSLGMCNVCCRRLTAGCECSRNDDAQVWMAAYLVAENELPTDVPSPDWLEEMYLDHLGWTDEQATRESVRPQ